MKRRMTIVDLTPTAKDKSSKVFKISYHVKGETIEGHYLEVQMGNEFEWVLILKNWKYINLKAYKKHLRFLSRQLNSFLESKYGFQRKRIIINHISNLKDPHNTGGLSFLK
ncbi:hypothetical protein ACFFJQ_07035 [Bacillus capparidis]|uniref:Uncharacterized protein n=1 Tax=Bacillus capparidis TaxID=1840411 RepID=A0ABS4D1M3_9BACI|nr:hypothetical protein [Bacillus capparidis]MBP1083522.1 hypothetical protein [Bacillus capparidis]MED1094720.1 hypothetical protein [Bacillus capparidis]